MVRKAPGRLWKVNIEGFCTEACAVWQIGWAQLKPDDTRWRTVGEVKGKHASVSG